VLGPGFGKYGFSAEEKPPKTGQLLGAVVIFVLEWLEALA